jgi:hypothetical protein
MGILYCALYSRTALERAEDAPRSDRYAADLPVSMFDCGKQVGARARLAGCWVSTCPPEKLRQ